MPDRESIHKLVDSLPKGALEAAERVLQSSQTWRPEPPRDVATMREDVKQRFARGPDEHVTEQMRQHLARTGMTGPQAFPTLYSHRKVSGVASEGETLVTFTIWRYQWHELEIEERFSLSEDKIKLLYSQQIQGPKGKKESFQIDFDCN
jgi:hypothetical protein